VESEKIKTIGGCPTPKNVAKVRSLIGLVEYYKMFTEDIKYCTPNYILAKERCVI
jgi:hypothetical protein